MCNFFWMLVLLIHLCSLLILNMLYLLCLLISIAYFTLLERKLMASVQRRTGPKIVGFYGILQPLTDGIKLLFKEIIIPQKANKFLFLFAPFLSLFLAFLLWCVVPFSSDIVLINFNFSILFIFLVSSLNIYSLIISGWSSNSKYAFLGALRSAAQVISYELTLSFTVLSLLLFVNSFNLIDIVLFQKKTIWFLLPCLPLFLLFIISMLAETNRIPFDLAEAEAEIVAGYNVEYSSIIFAMFFLAEYANMLFMSSFVTVLFFGGWLFPFFDYFSGSICFCIKVGMFSCLYVLIRATLPRFRYDQLMVLGWKVLLPLTFGFFVFYAGLIKLFNCHLLKILVI